MSSDDTFFGSGKDKGTILRPAPGGKSVRPRGNPTTQAPPAEDMGVVTASDTNVLVSAAASLLGLAAELRNSSSHPDPDGLFQHVSQEIQKFEVAARRGGATPEMVLASRYILCTLLDEFVLTTPWGHQSVWASQTLLNAFHNEGWGGEKFFLILDRLLQEPAKHIDLLELMYVCLALGFEGKMRVRDRGQAELDRIQTNLASTIRGIRGDFERELSPNWRGVRDLRTPLAKYAPLWVVCASALGILAITYFGFLLVLNSKSDPVAVNVAALGQNLPQIVQREAYVQPQPVTLRDLLAPEIQAGYIEIREEGGASTVILKGDGLFPSGSASIRASQIPVLQAVATALTQIPGRVLVTGHTDDIPIRNIRFPSNWHLSKHRAEAVRDMLAAEVNPERLLAEARSQNEPLVPNTSAENRAINRRVEITLFPGPGRR